MHPEHQDAASGPARGATVALVLLLLINLLNYVDRWVLAATEPDIRKTLLLEAEGPDQRDAAPTEKGTGTSGTRSQSPFPGGEPKTRLVMSRMGLLSSAFMVFYMFTAPLCGLLAGRMSRWLLVGIGVGLWSLASGTSGLAATYTTLLVTRCFVGVGEGAYGPMAPAILSDLYPARMRGRVLAWFYVAMPVGTALGYALGGSMAKIDPAGQSWRWAFYVVVIPGLLLAVWTFFMRDPARIGRRSLVLGLGAETEGPRPKTGPRRLCFSITPLLVMLKHNLRPLLRTPSYVLNTAGMTAMTFALGAFGFWMPGYLTDNHIPAPAGLDARVFFGAVLALAGLVGTPLGGMLGDALRGRFPGSHFLVAGVGLCLSVPCAWGFLLVPFPAAWVFVFLSVFFLFLGIGPSNAIVANVTQPSIRAAGFAVNIFVIHILGDAISPLVVGYVADHFGGRLEPGFMLVSGFMLLGGILWLCGIPYLARDTASIGTDHLSQHVT